MHFVAMLAFSMPGVVDTYDTGLTLFSLALALVFTGAGYVIIGSGSRSPGRLSAAGLLTGAGVVSMHYVGMAAMRMDATVSYDRLWVAFSILIAIGAATAALWLASRDQKGTRILVAAVAMGLAISGMHYAGMRAATFASNSHVDIGAESVGQTSVAAWVAATTLLILLFALSAAKLQGIFTSFNRREARIGLRLKIADALRSPDTSAALNEVVALMGEHFKANRTGYGQLDPDADTFEYDVCWTDGSVPALLGRFPAAAFGVKIVAALKRGETVMIDDILISDRSDEERTRGTAREVDTRAILVVPFVREGSLRTIVYLNASKPRTWRPDEVRFMEELAERTRAFIERNEAEAQLRELNASLEARVEARTAELHDTQEALLQSQKMEAIGQLAAGVAHDFNNLLGAVTGAFDLILRKPEDHDRVRKFAQAGLEAADRGAKLTGQLLAFSRSQRIQVQPVVVCNVIEGMRELLSRTLGSKIQIEFKLNPAPVPVLSDPTQVEMMVLNLVINARDAMADGGTVTIGTAVRRIFEDQELENGDYVEISVADTGTGMDQATLQKAMDPFFTTKEVGKGTGLGLAQVYGSAKQAGGAVRIESELGAGTTIRVILRCSPEAPAAAPELGDGDRSSKTSLRKILLVDDDDDLRGVVGGSLGASGYLVSSAANAADGLELFEADQPDAMVIDFAMPGMTGAELASRVRQQHQEMPIVVISGLADPSALERLVASGVVTLRKPFRLAELLAALERAASMSIASRRATVP